MGVVKIVILTPGDAKRQMAEIPDDAPVRRIVETLVKKMELPLIGPDSERVSYNLQHKESGKMLADSDTLGQVGVLEGETLRIQPVITAGRKTGSRPGEDEYDFGSTRAIDVGL